MVHDTEESLRVAQCDAKFNKEYLKLLQRRFEKRDKFLRILAGILSASVIGRALGSQSDSWLYISAVGTVLVTVIIPHLNYSKRLANMELNRVDWTKLANDYGEALRDGLRTGNWEKAEKEYKALKKLDDKLDAGKGLLPDHKDLNEQAYLIVCRINGDPQEESPKNCCRKIFKKLGFGLF